MNNKQEFNAMLTSSVSFFNGQLSYSGQSCRRIPEALTKLYGSKVHSLDLSYNELVSLNGLETFDQLCELILDNNQLGDSIILPNLPKLRTLSLNKNQIKNLELLLNQIKTKLPLINYISLLGNEACPNQLTNKENDEEDYQRYRYFVLYHLPNLQFLDSKKITANERIEARNRGKFMKIITSNSLINEESDVSGNLIKYSPLPRTIRNPDDIQGAYGKCRYKYTGKHSEGNRFISNNDL